MKKGISSLKTYLLIGIFVLLHHPLLASEELYTIQAGTYSLTALKFAEKHFDFLSRQLAENERDYLRVEEGQKYYIVRLGRFTDKTKALELLETVKMLVPDAFILKKSSLIKVNTVKLYERLPTAPVDSEYYTLQVGTFPRPGDAQEKVDELAQKLKEDEIQNLRVVKAGEFFNVRLGKFESLSAAREFLERIGELTPGAIILKAHTQDENIIGMYGKDTEDGNSRTKKKHMPVQDIHGLYKPLKPDAKKNTESVEEYLTEVSSYYDSQEYGKAAELLRRGIAKWPDNPDLRAWYGATLLDMQFPEKAYEEYRKAVELSPDVPEFHAGVGYSLIDIYMERARESITAFKKSLEIDPDNVTALEGLGIVYVSIDRKDLATDLHERLKDLDVEAADRLNQMITWGLDWGEQSSPQ